MAMMAMTTSNSIRVNARMNGLVSTARLYSFMSRYQLRAMTGLSVSQITNYRNVTLQLHNPSEEFSKNTSVELNNIMMQFASEARPKALRFP
jgi:hypothetical protein